MNRDLTVCMGRGYFEPVKHWGGTICEQNGKGNAIGESAKGSNNVDSHTDNDAEYDLITW